MNNQEREAGDKNESCCEGTDCCSVSSYEKKGIRKRWKTVIFTIVVLLAIGVTAYSIFLHDEDNNGYGSSTAGCAAPCGIVTTITGLDEKIAGLDFAMVMMLDSEEEIPEGLTESIEAAATRIKSMNKAAGILILRPDDIEFSETVRKFNIDKFPAVLTLGRNCSAVLSQGKITEEALMSEYQKTSSVESSCCPSKSGETDKDI